MLGLIVVVSLLLLLIPVVLIHLSTSPQKIVPSRIISPITTVNISSALDVLVVSRHEAATRALPNTLQSLATSLFVAGLPRFPRFFARDSIISALILRDAAMLRSALKMCAALQGKVADSQTGEEPGKVRYVGVVCRRWLLTFIADPTRSECCSVVVCIGAFGDRCIVFVQFPGVVLRGQSTLFSATDTTALFVIGVATLWQLTADQSALTHFLPYLLVHRAC